MEYDFFWEKKMKTLYKSEQSGRSMVEMLGVLAIIGVLSVGGIAGYSKAMAKFKTSKALDQVSTTVANIRTLYASQPNYNGLTTQIAIQMGAIGPEMLNGVKQENAQQAFNAFNGGVTVTAKTIDGSTDRYFEIVFDGLSREACVQMASSDWGSGSGSGLYSITAGENATGKTEDGTLPLNLATAAAGCNKPGDDNKVTWVYY